MTEWIDINEVVKVIEKSRKHNLSWGWYRNTECKYISLRVDMRDGHCVLMDREDNVITLEALQYQYRGDPKNCQNHYCKEAHEAMKLIDRYSEETHVKKKKEKRLKFEEAQKKKSQNKKRNIRKAKSQRRKR